MSKPGLNISHRYWRFSWFFSVTPGIVETPSKAMNVSYYILFLLLIIPTLDVG